MAEFLVVIARDVWEAAHRPEPDPAELRALAARVEDFAAAEPRLDPETRTNMLLKLARAVDPHTPRDNAAALRVLGLPAEEA